MNDTEKKELIHTFGNDENQKMLFSILEESKINFHEDEIMLLVENIYEEVVSYIINSNEILSIMQINKLFIKNVMDEVKNHYDSNFYKNKLEREQEKKEEINNRMIYHKNNFESFRAKKPEEIDFTEKNWREGENISSKESIEIKIKERENEINTIKNNYEVMEPEKLFNDDKKWFNKKKTVKNLKIENKNVALSEVQKIKTKNKNKKVRFIDENTNDEELKRKVEFLEKEVTEIKQLIKEVLEVSKERKKNNTRTLS